jgi:hypothetical protein
MQSPNRTIIDNVFFASGERGKEVRADGKGGTLKRGFYVRVSDGSHGPFNKAHEAFVAGLLLEIIDAEYAWRHDMEPRDRFDAAIANADTVMSSSFRYLPPDVRG